MFRVSEGFTGNFNALQLCEHAQIQCIEVILVTAPSIHSQVRHGLLQCTHIMITAHICIGQVDRECWMVRKCSHVYDLTPLLSPTWYGNALIVLEGSREADIHERRHVYMLMEVKEVLLRVIVRTRLKLSPFDTREVSFGKSDAWCNCQRSTFQCQCCVSNLRVIFWCIIIVVRTVERRYRLIDHTVVLWVVERKRNSTTSQGNALKVRKVYCSVSSTNATFNGHITTIAECTSTERECLQGR